MNRLQTFGMALLLTIPATAKAQFTIEDHLKAHAKVSTKESGTSISSSADMIDWMRYNRVGWRAINKGYFDTAEHEFGEAIAIAKRPSMNDLRLVARSYADYAYAVQKQGRYAEAEPLLKWALQARETLLVPESPAIAQSQNQLASLYYELGRISEAEALLRRAIDTQGKAVRPNPQEHARSQTLMGLLMVAQRRFVEAEPFFLKSLRLREKAQGSSHPDTGDCANNLAWAYHDQGKDDLARPLFERALRIFEQSRGPSDTSVAYVLNGIAQIDVRDGLNDEAESKYLRAIGIWDQSTSPGNSAVLDVLRHYADLLEELGRSADLARIKTRIAPLRAKLTMVEAKTGPWYRLPEPSVGVESVPGRIPIGS